MKKISSVNDFGRWDITQVGGKAYALSNLSRGGFNVPNALCINTAVYRFYVNQDQSLQTLIKQITEDKTQLEHAEQILINKFLESNFDEDFISEVRNELAYLGNINADYFAIRSSATTEDLIETSFAGQHDTFLDIQGERNILKAIKKCWLSLWSNRAVKYREKNGINHDLALMAVVIQKMIPAEKSGVIFTINPVSGDVNQILINCVNGGGEKLVSGIETPCEYLINKSSNKLIGSKTYNTQECSLSRREITSLTTVGKK